MASTTSASMHNKEPIAIVGTSCRFPGGCNSPSQLWELLREPRDLLKKVPSDRFNADAFYHNDPTHHGTTDATMGYFLDEDVAKFDNTFFNIQPVEAEAIDPQQRILLETVYDSLIAAGIPMENLKGSDTAVYVGQMCDDWACMMHMDLEGIPTYTATGISRSITSNRVSYFFDWHGPSMTIDTACSSSLVAVHEAVKTLRTGESKVAIAAGVNLILSPEMYICESNLHMLSPTGRSRMWDASADGYARGEGFASMVLKTLSQALADGDTIDCIIRETGVNQDGKTSGITMPSNIAQTNLIRETYARAGLDVHNPRDRPQLFHAHGTGTKAGDPQEAEAITRAFFDPEEKVDKRLYVGSIKTIIGHTEGTAGLASLISSMMAMRYSIVPPNMHFDNLNPEIRPFYNFLEVPTTAQPWPEVFPVQAKRASVNSFGFGGTNAHAIIESYQQPSEVTASKTSEVLRLFVPLLFSANSPKSLLEQLSSHLKFLQDNPKTDLVNLAWTLNSRRSTLPFRSSIVVSGSSHGDTCAKIEAEIARLTAQNPQRLPHVTAPRVLGVFTGQGAQWPRMGAELLEASALARSKMEQLDGYLADLPFSDRPAWKLSDQILASKDSSRVTEAALSQPLCTAVQLVLVDLLVELAGIQLSAVVGHSSGEMGAAYAAGLMSSREAISAAYYRGFYAKLASSPSAKVQGAMAAIGTDHQNALDLCSLEENQGRIAVAAVNSSTSVTLSGDEDAIDEAVSVFENEGRFARKLRVDTAYHSNHMLAPAKNYLEALKRCHVHTTKTNDARSQKSSPPLWFSSVNEHDFSAMSEHKLSEQYWVDNMVKPVMFASSLNHAVAEFGSFDMAIEFGPHPALQGPALETLGKNLPYQAILSRGKNDIENLASCLGSVWQTLGHNSVNFSCIQASLSGETSKPVLVKDLPTYPFAIDSQPFWGEPRISASFRQQHHTPHPILGRRLIEGSTPEIAQWRNILRSKEISWLNGHRLDGQIVFPATGFAVVALEAMKSLVDEIQDSSIRLLSLHDFMFDQALVFQDDSSSVELYVSLSKTSTTGGEIRANFTCASSTAGETLVTSHAHGQVVAQLGTASADAVPSLSTSIPSNDFNLIPVEPEHFHAELTKLGYQYSSPFTGLVKIQRKQDYAIGEVTDQSGSEWEDELLIHPGLMDSGLQAGIAAFYAPGDGRLWSLTVPVHIQTLLVNPYFSAVTKQATLPWEANAREGDKPGEAVLDVQIRSPDGAQAFVHIEGIVIVPLSPSTAANDNQLFSSWVYQPANVNGELASRVTRSSQVLETERQLLRDIERASFFHARNLSEAMPAGLATRATILEHFKRMLNWCDHTIEVVSKGEHPYVRPEHIKDTQEDIDGIMSKWADRNEVRLVLAAADAFKHIIPNNGHIHEYITRDGMLTQYYEDILKYQGCDQMLGKVMEQIVHRYPHMHILEVGAGTGAATAVVLPAISGAFSTYTYTDISTAFFEEAEERFSNQEYSSRLIFKALDMDKTPEEQLYIEGSYDVIIACMVLHATENLDRALKNVRRLLKPGGRLVTFDMVNNNSFRYPLAMGGFSGWWAGAERGRPWGPMLTLEQWDDALRNAGFAGIETATTGHSYLLPNCVFVAQASDDRVDLLSQPLLQDVAQSAKQYLTIIGGKSLSTRGLLVKTEALLSPFYQNIQQITSIEDLTKRSEQTSIPNGSSVLCLTELDEPLFRHVTDTKLEGLKILWASAKTILWVTRGASDEDPYSSLVVGLARSIRLEYSSINLQTIDFDQDTVKAANERDDFEPWTVNFIAESLRRLELVNTWSREEQANEPKLSDNLLWTTEPELRVSEHQTYIPRLITNKILNDRLNSSRREIFEDVDPQAPTTSFSLAASTEESSLALYQVSPLSVSDNLVSQSQDETLELRITQSLLQPIKIGSLGFFRLCVGLDAKGGGAYLALTSSTETPASIPVQLSIPLPNFSSEMVSKALLSVASQLVAAEILKSTPKQGGQIIIHEADPLVEAALLDSLASTPSLQATFTTCCKREALVGAKEARYIAPNTPSRLLKHLLPGLSTTVLLVDFSSSDSESAKVATDVSNSLPWYSSKRMGTSLLGTQVQAHPGACEDLSELHDTLQSAWKRSNKDLVQPLDRTISLSDIEGCSVELSPLRVIDWSASASVPIRVQQLDHKTSIFRSDKTYLLIGLSDEIGQSLCTWMANHGAKFVVLASRKPQVDQRFIESLGRIGVTILVRSVDVTSRESLQSCYDTICQMVPPIAGVANGSALLQHKLFEDMDAASLNKALAPTIQGSLLLDELFATKPLEFFLMFSSSLAFGARGHSTAAAANMFMTSLVNKRRKRGLAASIINISAVIGLDRNERPEALGMDGDENIGNGKLSVQDLHQIVAEAILAGQQRLGVDAQFEGAEIVAGIKPLFTDAVTAPSYYSDPKFSRMLVERAEELTQQRHQAASSSSVSVSRQLKSVTSDGDAFKVVKGALTSRLKKILRVPSDVEVPESVALVDQGVDSLVAVDVRTWFKKELDTDISVLSILGGNSIEDLANDALDKIPSAILDLNHGTADADAIPAAQPNPSPAATAPQSPGLTVSSPSFEMLTPTSSNISETELDRARSGERSPSSASSVGSLSQK